ncbi:MAG: hypothetical protein ACOYL6_05135 [Bacteriovoracaceae bacterium]
MKKFLIIISLFGYLPILGAYNQDLYAQVFVPEWVKDGRLMLGDDTKESFRAKDRLKDLDHLDQLLHRELRGADANLAIQMVKELKLKGLLPDIKQLAIEKNDKYLFQIVNSLTRKDDVKIMVTFYQDLKKNKKKSSYQGHLEFADFYNVVLDFADLAEMFQEGDEEDKIKVSEYLMLWKEKYSYQQVSFFVNTALGTAPTPSKIILVNGIRRLPDSEIDKYSINYKVCRLDTDKKLSDLCKMMSRYSKD